MPNCLYSTAYGLIKTELGKTYLKLGKLPKLCEHVNLIPKRELPVFNYDNKYNQYLYFSRLLQ
tara:strand:- start:366 stop:554 length:189 start_codon:yes stop_codon:yes gene_type:complete